MLGILKKFLLLSWPLLFIACLLLLWRGGYGNTLLKMGKSEIKDTIDYRENGNYREQVDLYQLYTLPTDIVMIGTSLTARISWAEALNRPAVANRGVNADLTAGILARVPFVIKLRPGICFIEGGINDIDAGIAVPVLVKNLMDAAAQLKAAGIQPMLTTILPVTKDYPRSQGINEKVAAANALLKKEATSKQYKVLDFRSQLCEDGFSLSASFTQPDGLHLNANAYRVWVAAVNEACKNNGL